MKSTTIGFMGILLLMSTTHCAGQQRPDLNFDVSVANPQFKQTHPVLLYDNGHRNSHQSDGTYLPFVKLMENDGCKVVPNPGKLSETVLSSANLLVISNAKGVEQKYFPAFDPAECDAVEKWVSGGGALLLIADHYPFGGAAESLAQKFGVHMFNGEVSDSMYFHGNPEFKDELVFSRENGLLPEHPITKGINTVYTFRGQSLSVPESAVALLPFSRYAKHALPDSVWQESGKTFVRFADPVSASGYCQGLALQHGKGRVLIFGEAAMFTAQVSNGEKFGMNTPGHDNRQFVLNAVHWLLGVD